jgi:hypothetical protein
MTFRRPLFVVCAAAFLAVFAGSAAHGAQPIREPLVIEDADFDNLCKFPVRIEITANKEYVKFFSDGRLLVNGKLFVRITNLETGESMDVNVSGPAHVTPTSERNMGGASCSSSPRTPEDRASSSTLGEWTSFAAKTGSSRTTRSGEPQSTSVQR